MKKMKEKTEKTGLLESVKFNFHNDAYPV